MGSDFFVVGIGASAGEESALFDLFTNIPNPINAAFIIVYQQKRDHQNQLKFLLSRHTNYPIYLVRNGEEVKSESIYLIPENTIATIKDGCVHLEAEKEESDQNIANDFFLSLAKNMKKRAIGIILSGMGRDGMNGANAIEEYGGLVMVQEPRSSDSPPTSVIVDDFPDHILPVRNMGMHLSNYINSGEHKNELQS